MYISYITCVHSVRRGIWVVDLFRSIVVTSLILYSVKNKRKNSANLSRRRHQTNRSISDSVLYWQLVVPMPCLSLRCSLSHNNVFCSRLTQDQLPAFSHSTATAAKAITAVKNSSFSRVLRPRLFGPPSFG